MVTKVKKPATKPAPLFDRVREILESARVNVARTVNTTQVVANWLIGREIVEEEQRGKKRADYGHKALADLSARLGREYGRGYSVDSLEAFLQFYLDYSRLISETASRNLNLPAISDTVRRESSRKLVAGANSDAVRRNSDALLIVPQMNFATSGNTCRPGEFNPNLSWTHYRTLLRVTRVEARGFYETIAH
jgi:DUF1016 N-terminal domain